MATNTPNRKIITPNTNGHNPYVHDGKFPTLKNALTSALPNPVLMTAPAPSSAAVGLTMQVVHVTPAMAAEWLARNHPRQRKMNPSKVRLFVTVHSHGHWKLTHQGIAFDVNNYLVDGQHRLQAIVDANAPMDIMVTWGLAEDAIDKIDCTPSTRGAHDILRMMLGIEVSKDDVALASAVWRGGFSGGESREKEDQGAWYIHVRDAIDWVNEHMKTRKRGVGAAPVRAVLVRAYYICKKQGKLGKLARFIEILESGARGIGPEYDDMVVRLHTYLSGATLAGQQKGNEAYRKTSRALQSYINGNVRNPGKYRCDDCAEELFPIAGGGSKGD